MHVTTLKPFDDHEVLESIANSRYGTITMENHSVIGGLGTIIAEQIAESGLGKQLVRIGLQDTFLHGASRSYLMRKYRLDAMALIDEVNRLTSHQLNISEDELAQVYIAPVHSNAKAEAL
jgi:transketolase